MSLHSITAFRKYGTPRSTLLYNLFNKKHWEIEQQECLSSCKLLCWTHELLQHKLHEVEAGTIRRSNKDYIVAWNNLDTRGQFLAESDPQSEWFLSFREPQPEYNLPNIVYIWKRVF